MFSRIYILLIVICAFVGLTACTDTEGRYSVSFGESKGLKENCKVVMDGIEIGKVLKIEKSGAGVSVEIDVSKENRTYMTNATAFYIDDSDNVTQLLAMNTKKQASQLVPGQTVEGTDSFIVWSSMKLLRKR